jgi:hypothetical protein
LRAWCRKLHCCRHSYEHHLLLVHFVVSRIETNSKLFLSTVRNYETFEGFVPCLFCFQCDLEDNHCFVLLLLLIVVTVQIWIKALDEHMGRLITYMVVVVVRFLFFSFLDVVSIVRLLFGLAISDYVMSSEDDIHSNGGMRRCVII